MRSFENASAASSFGCTSRMGQGSRCAKKPKTFSSREVFISCVATMALMISTPGSAADNMGPRATSTREVRHLPWVLPAPFACLRNSSAHAGTLSRGGGVQPRREPIRSRSSFSERVLGFAHVGKLLVDMSG